MFFWHKCHCSLAPHRATPEQPVPPPTFPLIVAQEIELFISPLSLPVVGECASPSLLMSFLWEKYKMLEVFFL
ncbi:hypothetical protein XENTR_v10024844 [Xenopus tropicalis]|nr:hypothetical protein XENTR_v10024844 [Xenopus tropicalis]